MPPSSLCSGNSVAARFFSRSAQAMTEDEASLSPGLLARPSPRFIIEARLAAKLFPERSGADVVTIEQPPTNDDPPPPLSALRSSSAAAIVLPVSELAAAECDDEALSSVVVKVVPPLPLRTVLVSF